jgi:hypothetical protein
MELEKLNREYLNAKINPILERILLDVLQHKPEQPVLTHNHSNKSFMLLYMLMIVMTDSIIP